MLRGPKAILSSAIANALGTYFELDASAIESNLIKDAKIVLNQVKLKQQTARLALNSAGNATVFTVNGCVERVELKWEWSVGYGNVSCNRLYLYYESHRFCSSRMIVLILNLFSHSNNSSRMQSFQLQKPISSAFLNMTKYKALMIMRKHSMPAALLILITLMMPHNRKSNKKSVG